MTTQETNFKVNVERHDSITGNTYYTCTIDDLNYAGWKLDADDISSIDNGNSIKLYNKTGRVVIFITKAK